MADLWANAKRTAGDLKTGMEKDNNLDPTANSTNWTRLTKFRNY